LAQAILTHDIFFRIHSMHGPMTALPVMPLAPGDSAFQAHSTRRRCVSGDAVFPGIQPATPKVVSRTSHAVREALTPLPPALFSPSTSNLFSGTLAGREAVTPVPALVFAPVTPVSTSMSSKLLSTTPPPFFPGKNPLLRAFANDSYEEVSAILRADAEAVYTPIVKGLVHYELPLLCAIRSGVSVPIVDLLLSHGAPVDQKDSAGLSPLSLVASARALPTFDMTSDVFTEIGPCDLWLGIEKPSMHLKSLAQSPNQNMLMLTEELCLGYAKRLLSHGANIHWRAEDALTAADRAALNGRLSLADFLCHWQIRQFLRAMWTRRVQLEKAGNILPEQSPHESFGLLAMPFDTLGLIFTYLTPSV